MEHYIQDSKRQALVVVCVAFAAFVSALDGNIVAITLPTIAKDLGVGLPDASRIILVYLLCMTASLPTIGKLGSLFGAKRVFQTGFFVFCVGSLLCGIAPSLGWLVLARILQALGGAALVAMGYALVGEHMPPERRGGAMGILSATAAVSTIIGAPVGGLLTEYFGWHSVFLINVPIGLIAIPIAHFALPKGEMRSRKNEAFDWLGTFSILVALIGILYGLNILPRDGWGNPIAWGSIVIGIVFACLFIRAEHRAQSPIIPGSLFGSPGFTSANVASILISIVMGGVTIIAPVYLEFVRKLGPSQSGVFFGIWGVMMLFGAPLGGMLSDRIGARRVCVFGTLLFSVAIGAVAFAADPRMPIWFLAASLGMVGFSMGLFFSPNSAYVMSSVPSELRAIASSTYNVLKSIGILFGIALFSALSSIAGALHAAAGTTSDLGITHGFIISMVICSALGLIACVASARMKSPQPVSSA